MKMHRTPSTAKKGFEQETHLPSDLEQNILTLSQTSPCFSVSAVQSF